ncbi:hypothetical protein KBC31_03240 [Candidatus Saccharibacteria bacterium]|jgi:hypothetical protein|nr:hypothetical protein [Candidatus Saccharibacteria bacterium]
MIDSVDFYNERHSGYFSKFMGAMVGDRYKLYDLENIFHSSEEIYKPTNNKYEDNGPIFFYFFLGYINTVIS